MFRRNPEMLIGTKSRQYCLEALRFSWPAILLWLLVGCTPDNVPLGPNEPAAEGLSGRSLAVDAAREGVFIVQGELEQPLVVPEQVPLEVGQGVAVDQNGRAIVPARQHYQLGDVTGQSSENRAVFSRGRTGKH